ncbi:uncharacterized protein [Montipora foliosa]|uniref:uncharacterized protein n=1 Tax=Montipora foliosa TaxID=591990 RepID=UPI0035F13BEF
MPKSSYSKKRKRDNKKHEEREAKKAKSNDNKEVVDGESDHTSGVTERGFDDIDEILEENAIRNNLTAVNVKSILHHVVSDKRVLAMVKNAAAESDEEEISDNSVRDFGPKMTRAKSKQTNQGDPIAVLASQSPIKEMRKKGTSKKKINFTELELPDSSSDEEYNPNEEEEISDEDAESCISFTSDIASPGIPGTPDSHKTDETKESAYQTQSPRSVTRSCSKNLLQESFKVPYPVAPATTAPIEKVTVVEEGDLIAKRTRSQLPLQDVPIESIEATFQAPDFTADMYDTIPVDDMDFEDIEWQRWLQGLVNSTDDVCVEEDHDDTEYNFMAEANQKEEKEEYRNDRAVRITQKEVNELLDELLKDYDNNDDTFFLDDDGEELSYLDMLNSRTGSEENIRLFSSEQLETLNEQLQQHTQLLTQIYLMAREDDSLSKEADLTHRYVIELKGFQERASNAELIRGLGDGMVHASAFSFPGLERAVEVVESNFERKRRTPSPRKCTTPKKDPKTPTKNSRRIRRSDDELLPPLSDTNMQLIATNQNVFRFVELLPHHSLLPRTGDTPKRMNGLRVKFSEAEDNLLALGMKQLGKKWQLIQEHLLPVKSPKQLQIRCKNLLSARAPENIIKYYRRNKELWELSSRRQVSSELVSWRPRRIESLEPLWLKNYKNRQRERRESQEKSEALVVKQAIEGVAYGRPIAPKFNGTACAVALPSNGEQATVTWVAIATRTSPWKAVTTPQPVEVVREAAENIQITRSYPKTSVDSDRQESVDATNESQSPMSAVSDSRPPDDANIEPNPSPLNEEPFIHSEDKSENGPSAFVTEDPMSTSDYSSKEVSLLNKENVSKEVSMEKTASECSTNKPTSKPNKSSREKNGGSTANSSGTSRKAVSNSQAGWGGNYIIEPDPKFRNRAQAFAEDYLAKVKKQLSGDPETYEEFLRTLSMSSEEECSPVELYKRIEVVLAEYPDLVEGFIGFLEPHQAVQAGVFMANQEFVRARTFLRKLEVHFQRSPSQFRKIINAFNSWNKKAVKDPLELRQTIVPMLKGQLHLIDELYSFFDDLKPTVCSDDDFEEVEFGSGSEPEVDDFEEVVIPCFVEPKKIKGRPAKDSHKGNTKKGKRPCSSGKTAKQQTNTIKPLSGRTKPTKTTLSKAIGKQEAKSGIDDGEVEGRPSREVSEIQASTQVTAAESRVDGQRTDVATVENSVSSATGLQSAANNETYRGKESHGTSLNILGSEHDGPQSRNSDSEEQEDDGNSCDEDEEDDDDDYADGDGVDYLGDNDVECDMNGDITRVIDTDTSAGDSDYNVLSTAPVPAKNLQRSQDGHVVLLWTREDDRAILQACQKMGAKPGTFQHIANSLKNKTADEVKKRFMDLLNLFKTSGGERRKDISNEDSCSDEEDEDGSETVGESEGEQIS